ncbi:MAG: VTT domain-containing protein [Rhodocyclaceae bacterium]
MELATPHARRVAARYARLGWRWRIGALFGVALCVLALCLGWRYLAAQPGFDTDTLLRWGQGIKDHPAAPLIVIGTFVAGSLIFFPFTALVIATGAVFGPLWGACYAIVGALASALAGFGLGGVARARLSRLGGGRLRRLRRRLRRRGLAAVLFVRIVPVAPFSVINLVAGASGIRLRDFMLGTLVGMAPGIVLTVAVVDRVAAVVLRPSAGTLALLAAGIAALWLAGRWLRRRVGRPHAADMPPASG